MTIFTLTTICGGNDVIRNRRCWGFYENEAKALTAIANNVGSIDDCLYDYLVLETYEPGIFAIPSSEKWFKWGNRGWAETDKPEWSNGLIGWAMG